MATVVRREGATPAHLSDMAMIAGDGTFHGWIGSKEIAAVLEREAMRVLMERRPCLICLSATPDREARPGVVSLHCQIDGAVEIYLAPVVSSPRLVLLGRSPISSSLAELARTIGYRVDLVDVDLAPGSAPGSAPGESQASHSADRVFHRYDDPRLREGDGEGSPVMAVVSPGAERSESDADMVAAALTLAPVYLGVIASRRRFTLLRDALVTRGLGASVDRIAHPAGLALGAHDPGEVAVGVLAQMIARRNGVATVNEASVILSEGSEVTSTMDVAVDEEGRAAREARAARLIPPGSGESPSGGTAAATASCFPQPVPEGETPATTALRVRASSPSLDSAAVVATLPVLSAVPSPPSLPSDGTPTVEGDVPDDALDPVCQAAVTISEARHVCTWQGLTWYFCGASCRSKFLANPLRYSAFAPGTPGPPGTPGTR